MNRILLSGTALVAATMLAAGGAVAADKKMMKPSISVNGYYEGVVGAVIDEETTTETTALDQRNDGEIHFNGRGSLENGMKIHMRAELEIQSDHQPLSADTDFIDEYFLSVSGVFGQIILGGTGGAPVKMLTGLSGSWATSVGETLNFDNAWVPSVAGNHYILQHSRLDTGDADKVTYLSPKFGGFQVGATYSPNRVNNDRGGRNDVANPASSYDGVEAAISYGGKFGEVGFGVGAGMTAYQGCDACSDANRSDWLVAARIDFGGGFRVAVAHKQVTDDNEAAQGQLTDLGVRYIAGANSFSLVGSSGQMENNDGEHTVVMGSYARGLGAGAKAHFNVIWNETTSTDGAMTNSGTALVSGIKVVF